MITSQATTKTEQATTKTETRYIIVQSTFTRNFTPILFNLFCVHNDSQYNATERTISSFEEALTEITQIQNGYFNGNRYIVSKTYRNFHSPISRDNLLLLISEVTFLETLETNVEIIVTTYVYKIF